MKRTSPNYMAEYMRRYRQVRRVKAERCACGNPAVRRKCAEWVCERCDALESLQAQLEFRSAELRELAGRKGQGGWRTRGRAVPELTRVGGVGLVETARRFAAQVVERANEIVVRGHGEYHLALVAGE